MLFTEFRFILFFIIVFSLYWGLQKNMHRKLWLLICSYIFYGAWDWRFLSLIWISTVVDYSIGWILSRPIPESRRKVLLVLSLLTNLGLLGFFKYFNFFVESALNFLNFLGIPAQPSSLKIILPVGISFYTFQTLSYSIDVYRRRLEPTKNLLNFALYVSFFPQLVAGPIVRASTFLPQLLEKRNFINVNARTCLILFLVGFIKKACISDNLAPIVDRYFSNPELYGAADAWISVLFYSIQIYCDFSGYSDMAIACAGLLGYELCLNFNFPYFASNIATFWRRWHISLSNWLRDYLYIPLGGNRSGKYLTYRNLMLTMLLGGLWHGAAWNFVIWGGMHGIALVAYREVSTWQLPIRLPSRVVAILGTIATFYWVCLTWVFFRAIDVDRALVIFESFVLFHSPGSQTLGLQLLWICVPLAIAHWITYRRLWVNWWQRLPGWTFAACYGGLFSIALTFVPTRHTPFIYFQF